MNDSISKRIENKIIQRFTLRHFQIINESSKHNSGLNNSAAETHFNLVLVCDDFNQLEIIQRHKLVYQLLDEELKDGIHALSLQLFAPQEWQGKKKESPPCIHSHIKVTSN